MKSCLCLDHSHRAYSQDFACRDCGDCCGICGDISSGPAFRKCSHHGNFSDDRGNGGSIRQCSVCGAYDGEHDWEVHSAEMRAGY